jgi:hypothetical protein
VSRATTVPLHQPLDGAARAPDLILQQDPTDLERIKLFDEASQLAALAHTLIGCTVAEVERDHGEHTLRRRGVGTAPQAPGNLISPIR